MDVFIGTLFVITCILLIIVVLLQKGRGGGLGAAFGGAGGGGAFGTRTGDVFTWVTVTLTALFLLLAVATTFVFRQPTGTVLPPVFQPTPGVIEEPVAVTYTCRTKGAEVRYTLDGTEPTEKSTVFEKSINVVPGTTIKARAYRAGWKPSPLVVARYARKTAATVPASMPTTNKAESRPAGQ